MTQVFLDLVNTSISAGWLVLAIVILRLLLKKAPRWIVCGLWALVAARLLLPVSIESPASLIPEPISSGQVIENISDTYWGDTKILQDGTAGYQAAVDAGREPISIGNGHYYVVTAPDGISEPQTFADAVIPIASGIWLTGSLLLVIYSAVSYLLVRRKVAAALHLREDIYLCDYIKSPFILGILRPRIYLPSSLDQSNWPHVLAHERAHLKRRDHWWKPLGFVLLCIHWFNPLLWLAYILLCRDIEMACDEKVINSLGDQGKIGYSEALLECSMPRYLIAACPLAFGEVGVKERVKSVLNYKKPAFWIVLTAMIASVTAAVCFLTDPVTEPEAPVSVFTATVVESGATWIVVQPDEGTLERNTANRIEVSLYVHYTDGNIAATGVQGTFSPGDRVRITYDGAIQEIYPARISSIQSIELIQSGSLPVYNSVEMAILDGCVTSVNGDVVAGQAQWDEFVRQTQGGVEASILLVTYHTVTDNTADYMIFENLEYYPRIWTYLLTYNGTDYQLRWTDDGTEYTQVWKFLSHYTGPAPSAYAAYEAYDCYVLTDSKDVTYEQLQSGLLSANFDDQIPFTTVYMNYSYAHEPTLTELENAKEALEFYMKRYNITTLDANELTMRLDIGISQWEPGLRELIKKFIDPNFVTISYFEGITLEQETQPAGYNTPDDFNVADILGTWEAYYYDDVLNDGRINDAYYVVDMNKIAKIRLYDNGTGLVFMMDATVRDITWEIVASDEPNTVHISTSIIDIWYHMDPQCDAYRCMAYPLSNGFNGIMVRISDDGTPVVFQGDAQISLTYPTSTESLVNCSLQIPANCTVSTGYDFELEVYSDGQWVHYGYPSEEQAWPDASRFYYENESGETVSLDFTIQESWSYVTDAPLPPGTYRYHRSFSFYLDGLYFSVPCSVEFTVSEDTPAEPGLHMEILNPTSTGATLAITYNGGLMGTVTTNGQYYLNVIKNGGATTYGLLPRQVDWEEVTYTLEAGQTIYLEVFWEKTVEAPLPVGTYSIVLLYQQHITTDEQTYQTDKRVVAQFAIVD